VTQTAQLEQKWSGRLLLASVLLWTASTMAVPLYDLDIWFHLNGGRWIAEHAQVPRTDPFTLVREGYPYVDMHWLFQLPVYGLWTLGGAPALVLLRVALAVGIVSTLAWALRPALEARGHAQPAALVAVAAVPLILTFGVRPRLRPELVTFLLLALQLGALVRFTAGRRAWGVAVVLAQIVLSNVQGLFVIGWLLCGALVLRALLLRARVVDHLVLGGIAVATGLVNPYGLEGFTFPFVLWTRINRSLPQFQIIGEMRGSLDLFDATAVFFVLCVASWLAAMWRCRRDPWGAFLIVFGGAAICLAWLAKRNLTLAGFAAVICVALAAPRPTKPERRFRFHVALTLAFVALAADCWLGKHLQPWSVHPDARLGLETRELPLAPMAHLDALGVTGNRFVDLNIGAYDAFVRGPGARSLTDARLEVLGNDGLAAYVNLLRSSDFFETTCRQFDLQAAIIDRRQPHLRGLERHLSESPNWVRSFSDPAWSVYLRDRTPRAGAR